MNTLCKVKDCECNVDDASLTGMMSLALHLFGPFGDPVRTRTKRERAL